MTAIVAIHRMCFSVFETICMLRLLILLRWTRWHELMLHFVLWVRTKSFIILCLYIYIYIDRERERDVCIYVYIHTYVCVSLSLYIYIYTYILLFIYCVVDLLDYLCPSHLQQPSAWAAWVSHHKRIRLSSAHWINWMQIRIACIWSQSDADADIQ